MVLTGASVGWSGRTGRSTATRLVKFALALLVAGSALLPSQAALARGLASADEAVVALADLPPQARQTEQLIRSGGPFPYAKDGTIFGNRELRLPRHERGYYREYTVATPGSADRGARRIVCGGRRATQPQACYYTADHYASFKRIAR